jgi:hypothetical protein
MLPFVRPGHNFCSLSVMTREVVATAGWLSVGVISVATGMQEGIISMMPCFEVLG